MFLQQLVNGLTLGSTYALIALGYSMVYGIIQLINFAHGEIFMVGAYAGLLLVTVYRVPIIPAFLGSMVITMMLGLLIERVAYRPLRQSSRLSALISTIGVSTMLSTGMLLWRGPQTTRFPDTIQPFFVHLGSVQISGLQLVILGVSAVLMVALQFLVKGTKLGRAMRATAQDMETARTMGVNVDLIIAITFAIGSGLAASAGVLVGLYFHAVSPFMGTMAGLKAFSAAVLGGIGSIPGAMLGGLLLGIAEIFGSAYLSSSYRDAIAFSILILVLIFRPSGLLGDPVQRKV